LRANVCSSLNHLDLRFNQMGAAGIQTLAQSLAFNRTLEHFDVRDNLLDVDLRPDTMLPSNRQAIRGAPQSTNVPVLILPEFRFSADFRLPTMQVRHSSFCIFLIVVFVFTSNSLFFFEFDSLHPQS
jgi:hypothetical protein